MPPIAGLISMRFFDANETVLISSGSHACTLPLLKFFRLSRLPNAPAAFAAR